MSPLMRRTAATAVVVVAAAIVALPAAAADQAVAPAVRPQILVLGDSLAVGMRPYLPALLPDADLVWDAVTGRTSPVGLSRLRADVSAGLQPQTVLVSLGTNDGSNPLRFVSRIDRILAAIPPTACVVWASINRPARKGAFAALNRVLYAVARKHRRMRILDWNGAVTSGHVVLPDHVHPDEAGFAYRAGLYARAARAGCTTTSTAGSTASSGGARFEPSADGGAD